MKISEMNEAELREADIPWPKTKEDMISVIDELVNRPHDYGTCVYAMSLAALAAQRYVASQLGVTGFQASCADLDFVKRSRDLKDGFMIIDYSDLLYPQYWNNEKFPNLDDLVERNKEHLKKRAKENIDAAKNTRVAKEVLEHWKMLTEL